jgi:hypothetical protein
LQVVKVEYEGLAYSPSCVSASRFVLEPNTNSSLGQNNIISLAGDFIGRVIEIKLWVASIRLKTLFIESSIRSHPIIIPVILCCGRASNHQCGEGGSLSDQLP